VVSSTLLIDLHYFPCLEYFACLLPYKTIYIEAQENYQKQTYCNRSYLLGSQKVERLTVPVIQGHKKTLYPRLKIDYSQPWIEQHWKTICTAYGKAPYFEYLSVYFQEVFAQHYTHLFALNRRILEVCLQILGVPKEIKLTDAYITKPAHNVVDARGIIKPTNRLSHPIYYKPFSYQQVFGTLFVPNLSILDLLFCRGQNAYSILNKNVLQWHKNT